MNKRTVSSFPYCPDDRRFGGTIEVLELEDEGRKTIGMCITVGGRSIPLPRNRIADVVGALMLAEAAASASYQGIIEEMNNERR